MTVVRLSFVQHKTEYFSVCGVTLRCYINYTGRSSSTECPWILEVHQNFKASSTVFYGTRSMWQYPLYETASLSSAEEIWRNVCTVFTGKTKSSDSKWCWWHCSPQPMSNWLSWNWTQASEGRIWRPTAWTLAQRTNYIQGSPFWEANSSLASQKKILPHFM
jgi:hypothetical protein